MQCPSCGKASVRVRANCFYCGEKMPAAPAPAPGTAPAAMPAAPVAPARPALLCQAHPDVPAVGRCFRCRRGICQTCAFKLPMGHSCPDCISAAAEETKKKGKGGAIASVVLGGLSFIFLVVGIFVAAAMAENPKEAQAMGGCLMLVSLGVAIAGLILGFVSRDKSRGGSILGLVGIIVNAVVLAIFLLLTVVGNMQGS